MMNEFSFLLGAGFSAAKGYPTGNDLNNRLLQWDDSKFTFFPNGSLVTSTKGTKPDCGYITSYEKVSRFVKRLVQYYHDNIKAFDYEEFYDFYKEASDNKEVEKLAEGVVGKSNSLYSLLGEVDQIFNQVVAHYLKPQGGKTFYDDEPYLISTDYPGYQGFGRLFRQWLDQGVCHVHTLNHDLFFESFRYTDIVGSEFCDGFTDLGSRFFGDLIVNDRRYRVRLEEFQDKYEKKCRLYKLHGSLDYMRFYETLGLQTQLTSYVKTRYGIDSTYLYKETESNKGPSYINWAFNYHPDFLTGTTSKIARYNEPILFNKLVNHFKENLTRSNLLVIIGYGGKDSKVNDLLEQYYKHEEKEVFIVDPFPGPSVKNLRDRLSAKLIDKKLEFLSEDDFKNEIN